MPLDLCGAQVYKWGMKEKKTHKFSLWMDKVTAQALEELATVYKRMDMDRAKIVRWLIQEEARSLKLKKSKVYPPLEGDVHSSGY